MPTRVLAASAISRAFARRTPHAQCHPSHNSAHRGHAPRRALRARVETRPAPRKTRQKPRTSIFLPGFPWDLTRTKPAVARSR